MLLLTIAMDTYEKIITIAALPATAAYALFKFSSRGIMPAIACVIIVIVLVGTGSA